MLPKLLRKYNNRVHRSTGLKPYEFGPNNVDLVYDWLMNKKKTTNQPPKFKQRYCSYLQVQECFFQRIQPIVEWGIFSIEEVKPTISITYILKDVKGRFYEHELQKTNHRDIYLVEKILKREGMLGLHKFTYIIFKQSSCRPTVY